MFRERKLTYPGADADDVFATTVSKLAASSGEAADFWSQSKRHYRDGAQGTKQQERRVLRDSYVGTPSTNHPDSPGYGAGPQGQQLDRVIDTLR